MIRNLQVSPVFFRNEIVGYSVVGSYRDCSDSLYERMSHHAIFRTEERAERFLAKVRKTNAWNLKYANWNLGYSWEGCYSVL